MIKVYPYLRVYCPKEGKEQNGQLCIDCLYFNGVSIDDHISPEQSGIETRLYFRCFHKKEAEGEQE